jgi:hypothetical protein
MQKWQCTWRSDQQGALGDVSAQLLVLGRLLQEVDELHDLGFCFIAACHILEGDLLG